MHLHVQTADDKIQAKINNMIKLKSLRSEGSNVYFLVLSKKAIDSPLGWTKMHDVFKSLLPRYFLKDIYVK